MRVQPARPSRPLTTTVTRSAGDASAAWSAAVRPAPPAPRMSTSVSRVAITARGLLDEQTLQQRAALRRGPRLVAERLGHQLAVAADQEHGRRGGDAIGGARVALGVEQDRQHQVVLLHEAGDGGPVLLDVHGVERQTEVLVLAV